jgi:pimeloyl-ACP methyl ester carboxylesterase
VSPGALIDRGFHRSSVGLIHYRRTFGSGAATALVMAHGGPGSSAGLVPLIAALGEGRTVVAPDMMGNGESDPPPAPETTIGFYAERLLEVMDHIGLEAVDFYGHHTGAQVVCELAIARPERVRRVILDGVALFDAALRVEFLERYAPAIVPDAGGGHLAWVWDFIAQTTQHFPHYRRDAAHEIAGGRPLPSPLLTDRAAEVLKVWSTYHLAYRAAFAHDMAARIALLPSPALILEVAGDPLAPYAERAVALAPNARLVRTSREDRAGAIAAFLDG